jgi:glutathione S-transferase
MVLKLYAAPDSSKAKRILIAATYNGISIEAPADSAQGSEGKMPVLETDEGCIFSTNAIARYVARIRRDTGVYGQTFIESGAIDGWVEFCQHELEVPLCVWVYPKLGIFEEVPAATKQAKEDVAKAMGILNKHLESHTFMVGHQVTLADITIASCLLDGFVHVMDEAFRGQFPNVVRWFETCVNQPQFVKVLGPVTMLGAKGAAKAAPKASPKKEAKASPKKEAKGSPKKEAAKPAAAESGKKDKKDKGKADAAPAAPDSPELEAVKKEIADTKAKLKESGKSGGEINKDPAVVALVQKMNDIKAGKTVAAAPAAAAPAATGGYDDKVVKKVKKEGGKKGSEVCGACEMGNMSHFNVSLDGPDNGGATNGDLGLMEILLGDMNMPVDPEQEETKGGSAFVAKCLFSYGSKKVGILVYCPPEQEKRSPANAWCKAVVEALGGKMLPGATGLLAKGEILGNEAKGLYPIKIKDEALQKSIQHLQNIGVFGTGDDDSDDEMVFGDDDFPCG